MKISISLIAILLFSTIAPAQLNIDSLKAVLDKWNPDTTRVQYLREIGYAQKDLSLLEEALALAQKIKYDRGIVNCYNGIGNLFFGNSDYLKAMEFYIKGLKLSEEINYAKGIAKTTGNIAAVHVKEGNYDQALDLLHKSINIYRSVNDIRGIAIQSYDMGRAYLELGKIDSALFYSTQGYQNGVASGDSNALTNSLYTLGEVHHALGNDKLALEYYRMAIPFSPGYTFTLPEVYISMANVFLINGHTDSSILYAQKGLEIAQKQKEGSIIFKAGSLLSRIYEKKDLAQSLYYYKLAIAGKDSMFSTEKVKQLENISNNEILRQREKEAAKIKDDETRKHNLQYAAIVVGLITFLILFLLLSRSIIVKTKFIEFFGVLGLLAVFEFINLFIHPYLAHATDDSPILMLLVLIAIGALLIPLHHKLEKWITTRMVEKNKKIRLEAAKKTVANLEG